VIKELLILDGHVAKDKFVNAYIEVIQGTKATAEAVSKTLGFNFR